MTTCTLPIQVKLIDNNGQVELNNLNNNQMIVTQIPAGTWPSGGVTIAPNSNYIGNIDLGSCLMYQCDDVITLLDACATIVVDAATVFGPIKPDVTNGTGPFNYVTTVFIPSTGRTITVAGSDLTNPPSTVTDTQGTVTTVDGDLGCWSLDRFSADIPPETELVVSVQVTDTADGSTDTNTLSYIPS
jgi:hypothetical protein